MRMSADDRWATQGPPEWDDEERYLEHEAREQGEADLLNDLLRAHATAWWRPIDAADFVEQVNETYAAYEDAGGNDAHYFANWRKMSDAASAERNTMRGCRQCHVGHSIQACPAIKTLLMQEDT